MYNKVYLVGAYWLEFSPPPSLPLPTLHSSSPGPSPVTQGVMKPNIRTDEQRSIFTILRPSIQYFYAKKHILPNS